MKTHTEIKEMLDHIIYLQRDAEHHLDEHFLMPYQRAAYERTLIDTARDAQVLLWVLGDQEVAIAG